MKLNEFENENEIIVNKNPLTQFNADTYVKYFNKLEDLKLYENPQLHDKYNIWTGILRHYRESIINDYLEYKGYDFRVIEINRLIVANMYDSTFSEIVNVYLKLHGYEFNIINGYYECIED